MAKLVTIYGGSGFVGRQVARLMARRGWRVRIAVRRPRMCLYCRASIMRSVASSSLMRSPLTSTVTLWIVPVNRKGAL